MMKTEMPHSAQAAGCNAWTCPLCGSLDMSVTQWVDANTGKVTGDSGEAPLDLAHCESCGRQDEGMRPTFAGPVTMRLIVEAREDAALAHLQRYAPHLLTVVLGHGPAELVQRWLERKS
jgi:hypothetical protein